MLVETTTNNNNRIVANIRVVFNKCNGNLGTSEYVSFMFDHVVNFKIREETLGMSLKKIELEVIEFEVEEIFKDEEAI